jgi:acetolactate synthase-1/2/3 large subunit
MGGMQATEQITRTVERMGPGRAVVASLLAHGVDTVFGLDGSHVIQVFDALADAPSIAPLTFKHENNAAVAAEMYGRLTGRPGVVLVTAGPGATNSLSGTGGAYAAGAPVVHISGGVPVGAPYEAFHGVDGPNFIQDAFKGVTKWSVRIEDAGEIPAALAKAFQIAVSGRPGPTHIEIAESALNVKEIEVDQAGLVVGPTSVYDGADSLPNLDDLVARIDGAARIAIVAGKGAMWGPVSEAIVTLAERLGAPVAHTWDGHASMPTVHPLSMGVWWGAARSHPTAAKLVAEADLVLGIGVRPGTEVGVGLQGEPAPVVLLDASDDPSPTTGPALGSVGQLAAAVEKLAAACRARETERATLDACAKAREIQQRGIDIELDRYKDTRPWHIGAAIDALSRRMTPDTFVISDVSNVKLWTPIQVPTWGPESHYQSGSWGAMGYCLPSVLAAARLRPTKKIVGLCGDTSFLMASSDFLTICEQKLPVVIAIHHDQRIGMIDNMHTKAYGRAYASEIGRVDFVKYAEAFGATGLRVEDPADLEAAWDTALASDGPFILELRAGHDFPWPWPVSRLVQQAEES